MKTFLALSFNNYMQILLSIFTIAVLGIITFKKSLITILINLELLILAINLQILIFSAWLDDVIGQIFALFVLTVAAAESAIGLAILIIYFRLHGTIYTDFVNAMKG